MSPSSVEYPRALTQPLAIDSSKQGSGLGWGRVGLAQRCGGRRLRHNPSPGRHWHLARLTWPGLADWLGAQRSGQGLTPQHADLILHKAPTACNHGAYSGLQIRFRGIIHQKGLELKRLEDSSRATAMTWLMGEAGVSCCGGYRDLLAHGRDGSTWRARCQGWLSCGRAGRDLDNKKPRGWPGAAGEVRTVRETPKGNGDVG